MFTDLTEWGGRLLEWRLTPAPYFFPDMALYFPIATMTSSWHVAFMLVSVIQMILFTLGWCLLGQYFLEEKEKQREYIFFVLIIVAFLMMVMPYTGEIMAPQFSFTLHFGVMLVLPYLLTLTWRSVKGGGGYHHLSLVGLTLMMTFIILSDRIALVQLVLPLLVAIFFVWVLKQLEWIWLVLLTAVSGTAWLLAEALRLWLVRYRTFTVSYVSGSWWEQSEEAWENFVLIFKSLWQGEAKIVLVILIVAGIVHLGVLLISWGAKRPDTIGSGYAFLSGFAVATILLSIMAVIVSGLFLDIYSLRYLYPVTVLPIYSLMPIGFWLLQKWSLTKPMILVIAVITISQAGTLFTQGDDLNRYADFYPPGIICIDEETAKRQVQVGVGSYWYAKRVTMLSKQNLMILPVENDFTPYIWITNPKWFERYRPAFIIHNPTEDFGLQMGEIINRYGYPQEIVNCSILELWFYNRPEDLFFQTSFGAHPDVANWCEPIVGREIPGYVWRGPTGINIGSTIVSDEEAGVVASGELIYYPKGNYSIRVDYEYDGEKSEQVIGEVALLLTTIGTEEERWLRQPLFANKNSEMISFILTGEQNVTVEVAFVGVGQLTLNQFYIEKQSGSRCR
ncbi:MAG TPA: hypothetical protein VLL52_06505 [Anaerolineae bacterium]|nr:hypothetical protein [Anaerolineae bacterium]